MVFVMVLTSSFLVLIMILIWKTHLPIIIFYVLIIGLFELLYLSSVLYKFNQGGYLPLAFAGFLMSIMYTWNDVHRRKYYYELEHKISPQKLKDDIDSLTKTLNRVPGLGLFYSKLVHGIPPIFKHYLSNIPTLQRVLIFVSFKSLPISKVLMEERFLFRRVEPDELNVFRCVVRYGYRDIIHEQEESFEKVLVERLKVFIEVESWKKQQKEEERKKRVEEEIEVVDRAWKDGIVHLIGQDEIVASKGSGLAKRVLINYVYDAIRRNLRQNEEVFDIPRQRMLKVGMTCEL